VKEIGSRVGNSALATVTPGKIRVSVALKTPTKRQNLFKLILPLSIRPNSIEIQKLTEASLQVFGKASHELIRGLVSLTAAN
jgi:hypothetical protein